MTGPTPEFPPTRWTLVELAGRIPEPVQEQALADLLPQYLPALEHFLVAQFRFDPTRAEDLLQSFLLSKVVQGRMLAKADRTRGRFRTFLLQTLTRFVISEQRRAQAHKRSPVAGFLSLDELPSEPAEFARAPDPSAFDLAFARQIVGEAVRRMEDQCVEAGRPDVWGVFTARLLGPIFDDSEPTDYATLVERFGFQSPSHASNVLVTAKRTFARVLRSVLAEYVPTESELEAELLELQSILATDRAGTP